MLEAVPATYNGTNFILKRDVKFEKGQDVIITFFRQTSAANEQRQSNRKAEALGRLERIRKHVPGFDYKRELNEYRQERFGNADIG